MEKEFKHNNSSSSPQVEPDVVALIKKIQQHLVFLEKKIDTLISRSSEKPSKGQHLSRPFRSYSHSQYHGKKKHYNSSREGGFDQERHFNREQGGGKRRFDQERHFNREQGGGKQRFDQGKKPFFQRRKKRA